MGLLKFLGGWVLAILGFMGMIIAVAGFFTGQIIAAFQNTPIESWPIILIFIVALLICLTGTYFIKHDC